MSLPKTPSFSLKGKRALVVGASSGIGKACAIALAEYGASVTLGARRLSKLSDLMINMKQKKWSVSIQEMDIVNIEKMQNIINSLDPFDILVNSAGMAKHTNSFKTSIKDFESVMNVNLKGAYFLTQAVAKSMVSNGSPGSIINISSQMGLVGGQERTVYCASKHAVEGFTKAMAIEYGAHNIRVNTICPTFILTDMTQDTFNQPEKRMWIEGKIKLGRVGRVEDLMGAIVYLASDASSLVTGSSLLVDGGWTAG